jgi:hypothetical protein
MPFKIGNKVIPLDTPFTHGDLQYPANWIRLASEEDKAAIGLVWEADPIRADDRFYWDGNINNPKALEDVVALNVDGQNIYDDKGNIVVTKGLKSQFIAQVKAQAGSLLNATDWKVVRAAEGGKALDDATKAARIAIRTKSDEFEAQIKACTTVEQLAALQFNWE